MTNAPFYIYRPEGKRDLVSVRQKARHVARLLHFDAQEEACIAAGTFAIACQVRQALACFEICFQIDHHQLMIYARSVAGGSIAEKSLLHLSKPLPESARQLAVEDLCWLLGRIEEQTPVDLFGEICRQNEEILGLLSAIRVQQGQRTPAA